MGKVDLEYIENLAEQYKRVYGINSVDLNSKSFLGELNEWIGEMQKQGEEYTKFLDDLGINFKSSSVAEVGKGEYDSVVKSFNTSIITKMPIYSDTEVIDAKFLVFEDGPKLLIDNQFLKFMISAKDFSTFMTQNPYSLEELENWEKLSLLHNYNIIVGMYGRITDKDRLQKLEQLNGIREKLSRFARVHTETKDGNYFTVLTNKKMNKIKSIFR